MFNESYLVFSSQILSLYSSALEEKCHLPHNCVLKCINIWHQGAVDIVIHYNCICTYFCMFINLLNDSMVFPETCLYVVPNEVKICLNFTNAVEPWFFHFVFSTILHILCMVLSGYKNHVSQVLCHFRWSSQKCKISVFLCTLHIAKRMPTMLCAGIRFMLDIMKGF